MNSTVGDKMFRTKAILCCKPLMFRAQPGGDRIMRGLEHEMAIVRNILSPTVSRKNRVCTKSIFDFYAGSAVFIIFMQVCGQFIHFKAATLVALSLAAPYTGM